MGKADYELKQQGKQAYFNGDFDEAIRLFSEAIKVKHNDPNLYGLRCTAYNKLQKYQEALDDVTKMLELRPYNYKGYLIQGSCQFHLAKYEDAVESYAKALQAQPSQDIAKTVAEAMAKINYHRKRATNNSLIRVESTGTILSADDRAHRIQKFRQHCSAIRIQCWWKGYEVRKKFGEQISLLRNKVKEEFKAKKKEEVQKPETKDQDYETASEGEVESSSSEEENEVAVEDHKPAPVVHTSAIHAMKKADEVKKKQATRAAAKAAKPTKNISSESLDLKSTKKSDTSTSKKNLRSSTSAPVVKTQEKPLEKTQEKTLEKDKSVRSGPRFNKSGTFYR